MKPLIILTSLNFVVCCFFVIKGRFADSGPDPNPPGIQQRVIPVLNPDEEPDKLSLRDLLSKPREELARRAEELEVQLYGKEGKEVLRQTGRLNFTFLPMARFPHATPIWQQARFSAKRDMVLPPYLGEDDYDSVLALHLARFGDVDAAKKIVDPKDSKAEAEIERLRRIKNFPAEWTRLVALILDDAHFMQAGDNNNGIRKIVALHRQLHALFDEEVRNSPLGTALLGRGRRLLHQAVLAWNEPRPDPITGLPEVPGGQEEYVELASVGLSEWGDMATPFLPSPRTPEELATLLGGKAQGLLVTCDNPLRALDMLGLPLPDASLQGVVGLFNSGGSFQEILVVYGTDVPEPHHLTRWVDEQIAASSPLRVEFRPEACLTHPSTFVGPIVRLIPKDQKPTTVSTLPRDFGLVNLDRTFEANRRVFGRTQSGPRVTINDARTLTSLKMPYPGQKPSQATLTRDEKVDLVASFQTVLEKDASRSTFIAAAAPIWQKIGASQIKVSGDTSADSLDLTWNDGTTELVLRFPHSQDAASMEVHDAATRDSAQRLASAIERDTAERKVRWDADKPIKFVSRSIQEFTLGMTRQELEKRLNQAGKQTLRNEVDGGDLLTFPGIPNDDGLDWTVRQCVIRFDDAGKLVEVRARITDAPQRKVGSFQKYLTSLRGGESGAPEIVEQTIAPKADSKPGETKPAIKLFRWQDDATFLQARVDAHGIELILKDCPLEYPQGLPSSLGSWLPRGPARDCLLGTTRSALLAHWKTSPPENPGEPVALSPADNSPYDQYLVYLDGDKVTRIVAKHRLTEPLPNPAEAGKAVKLAWGQQTQVLGWPWLQTFSREGFQSWSSQDDVTLVRIFWQRHGPSGLRVFTEWK